MYCAAAQDCMMHHTMPKKIIHSTAASQERTPAKLPAVAGLPAGQTYWRARWASPVSRTCLIVTTRYGRSRNQPLPNSCSCCRRRGIAKPARTVTLSRRPSKQSWVCSAAGSACIWLRLGMRMPRVWRTAVLLAVRSGGSSCCVGTKILFRFILHTFDRYFKHHFQMYGPTPGCTCNSDIHMKKSLHTHKYVDGSIRVHKSTYFYMYVSYTHVWTFFFAYFHILFLNVYLFMYMYLCEHVCMCICMYVCIRKLCINKPL